MSPPALTFVIPVRNDARRLRDCLSSIAKATHDLPVEFIVADNGSVDGSADVGRDWNAKVLALPELRVSQLRNSAARMASSSFLAFIDADHEISEGWAQAALNALNLPSAIAVGAPYRTPPSGTWVQSGYDALRHHPVSAEPTDWLPSGNLVVRKSAFMDVGGFDEGLEACEDVDLCKRLSLVGRLYSVEGMKSTHHGDPRTLKALFFGELWRGRNDLQVTLRKPVSVRSVLGTALRLAMPFALIALPLALWSSFPSGLAAALVAVAVGPIVLRTVLIYRRARRAGGSALRLLDAFLVAATYESARVLALVARRPHSTRRVDET